VDPLRFLEQALDRFGIGTYNTPVEGYVNPRDVPGSYPVRRGGMTDAQDEIFRIHGRNPDSPGLQADLINHYKRTGEELPPWYRTYK